MIKVIGGGGCAYCDKAKDLLERQGIPFEYLDARRDPQALQELKDNKMRTIPQIWVDDKHIGGYEDLVQHVREKNIENSQ